MKYKKINKALAEEFGKKRVELRPYKKDGCKYILWFSDDNPKLKTIKKAMTIVEKYKPSQWFPERSFKSKR